jgi:hypothetical protein
LTESSRRSLEFGYWTEVDALLEGAERFLVKLMRSSEALDPDSDHFDPDMAPVEYDHEMFGHVMNDMGHHFGGPDDLD